MDVGLAAKALISAGAGKTISPLTSVFLYRSAASPRQPTSSNRAPSIMQRYFVFMEYPPSKQQRPAASGHFTRLRFACAWCHANAKRKQAKQPPATDYVPKPVP